LRRGWRVSNKINLRQLLWKVAFIWLRLDTSGKIASISIDGFLGICIGGQTDG